MTSRTSRLFNAKLIGASLGLVAFTVTLIAVGIGAYSRAGAQAQDWHSHGPEKLSAVLARVAGPGWAVDWQAATDPVVDPDALWKSAVLLNRPDETLDALGLFLNQTAEINPAWAYAVCGSHGRHVKVVPMEDALAPGCRT